MFSTEVEGLQDEKSIEECDIITVVKVFWVTQPTEEMASNI